MTVGYNPGQKVREELNHRSPFSRTQVLAALGGGEEGRGGRSYPDLSRTHLGLLVLKRLTEGERSGSQTLLFQAGRNGGESDLFQEKKFGALLGTVEAPGIKDCSLDLGLHPAYGALQDRAHCQGTDSDCCQEL